MSNIINSTQKPMVSVIMITYGHENYIEEAINGVLMQEGDFDLEVIIANDNSPDKTSEVIKKIMSNHPKSQLIKYFRNKMNLGIIGNFLHAMSQGTGNYLALCEGDDFWIDPLKLQKQLSFLESNKEYVLTGHHRIIVDENSKVINDSNVESADYHTQCLFFRNILQHNFLSYDARKIVNGDTFLLLYLENFGRFKLLDFNGSAYRQSNSGVWALKSIDDKFAISNSSFETMMVFFRKYNYNISIKKLQEYIIDNKYRFAIRLKEENRIKESLFYFFKFLGSVIKLGNLELRYFKMAIIYFFNKKTC
jgi:glycosyltransferase involved in cell wall biosynthesis